jgi:hypothetical protein
MSDDSSVSSSSSSGDRDVVDVIREEMVEGGPDEEKKPMSGKKRAKLDAMKAKKKQKREDGEAAAPLRPDGTEKTQKSGLSGKQAYALLVKHRLEALGTETECLLKKESFMTPPQPANKVDCPFSAVIRRQCGKKALRSPIPGAPLVIIVCSAARRAVEIIKPISLDLKYKVAKLFSKHMKVEDQVEMLKSKFPIAVGTPNRLMKLHQLGALQYTGCRLLLVDGKKNSKDVALYSDPSDAVKSDFFLFLDSFLAAAAAADSKDAQCSSSTHTKFALVQDE